jgi:hypothetical protein
MTSEKQEMNLKFSATNDPEAARVWFWYGVDPSGNLASLDWRFEIVSSKVIRVESICFRRLPIDLSSFCASHRDRGVLLAKDVVRIGRRWPFPCLQCRLCIFIYSEEFGRYKLIPGRSRKLRSCMKRYQVPGISEITCISGSDAELPCFNI